MNTSCRTRAAALILTLGLLTTACSGRGTSTTAAAEPEPAGVEPTEMSVVFTRGMADLQFDTFQDELAARTGGAITVRVDDSIWRDSVRVEQEIVEAVANGDLDLGLVGARAFHELGIRDFDALVAPMALDSLAAQDAVLSSDLPTRMMAGLEPTGVKGLAVVGGPMRRPIADRPLTTLADFAGLRFFTWLGASHGASIESLGAEHVNVPAEARNSAIEAGTIHALENSLVYLADTADRRTNTMTVDVNLWPSVSVLVANPTWLSSLSDKQRDAVIAAADSTAAGWREILADEQDVAAEACTAGAVMVAAGEEAVAQIEAAFEPARAELRADPMVAGYLDGIEELTQGIPHENPQLPHECA